MITDAGYKVLGGSQVMLNYICNSQQQIRSKLYPEELRNEIEKHFSWFQARMKPSTQRLIKMITLPKSFQQPPTP